MAQDPPELRKDFKEAAQGKPADPRLPAIDPAKNSDKGIDSIKRHKPTQAHDMRGPGGAVMRQDAAKANYAKDWEKTNSDRGAKYANIEKKAVAGRSDVLDQSKGRLSQEHKKSTEKPI
jgi:hypothetical protein